MAHSSQQPSSAEPLLVLDGCVSPYGQTACVVRKKKTRVIFGVARCDGFISLRGESYPLRGPSKILSPSFFSEGVGGYRIDEGGGGMGWSALFLQTYG